MAKAQQHPDWYEVCYIKYADDGRKQRSAKVRCHQCKRREARSIETPSGKHMAEEGVINKFKHHDWQIDPKHGQHLCPQCVNITKPAAPAEPRRPAPRPEPPRNKVIPMPTKTKEPSTPDEKQLQLIAQEMDGHYDPEHRRYFGADSDAAVAERLNMAPMWIANYRLYRGLGPDTNEIEAGAPAAVAAAKAAADDAAALLAEAMPKAERAIKDAGDAKAAVQVALETLKKAREAFAATERQMVTQVKAHA